MIKRLSALAIAATAIACADPPTTPLPQVPDSLSQPAQPIAIVGVAVISVETGTVASDVTVIIDQGRIASVRPMNDTTTLPQGAFVVDGTGRYLAPGLFDMHVHVRRVDLVQYIAHGITSVRHMWAWPGLPPLIDSIERGDRLGPRIYTASPGIDGDPPYWPGTVLVTNPDSADAAVARLQADGWKSIKVYDQLTLPVYQAVAAAAKQRGLPIVGHIPIRVTLTQALAAGHHSIEHLFGYERASGGDWATMSTSGLAALAQATKAAGAWNCPTLVIWDTIVAKVPLPEPARVASNRRAVLSALRQAGARILIGTDAGTGGHIQAGVGMTDEMIAYKSSGFTNAEILRVATLRAAEYFGLQDSVGTVAAGKWADLLLLDADPTRDISAVTRPAGVVLRGHWYPRSWLTSH